MMKTKQQLQDNSNYNYLGRQYTFFLSNYSLPNDSFYLYTIVSPGMMRDFSTPLISLKKVGERCKSGVQGFEQDRDILTYILGGKEGIDKKSTDWIKTMLHKDDLVVCLDGTSFPRVESLPEKAVQKSLITGIKDTLRWKFYRFFPGRKLDVLWTPEETVLFDIKGDSTSVWLEPIGVFKNTDFRMEEPLNVDLETINYKDLRWGKGKISEINQAIRRIEWNSFETRFRFKKIK